VGSDCGTGRHPDYASQRPAAKRGPELFGGDGDRLAFRSYDEANGWEFKFFNFAPPQQPSAQ
jgi:hypothetical protein